MFEIVKAINPQSKTVIDLDKNLQEKLVVYVLYRRKNITKRRNVE